MSASFTFLLACGLQIDAALHGDSTSSRMSPAATRAASSLRSKNGPLPPMGEGGDLDNEPGNVTFGRNGKDPTRKPTKTNGVGGSGLRNADSNPYSFHMTSAVLNSYPVYPNDPYEVLSGRMDDVDLTNSRPVQQVAHRNDDGEHYVEVRL